MLDIVRNFQSGAILLGISAGLRTETRPDLRKPLNDLIPFREIVLSAENSEKSLVELIDQINQDVPVNVACHCGGGPIQTGPIPVFEKLLNPAHIHYLKRTRAITFSGAFGHTGPKYNFAFTANLDFTAGTPTELGQVMDECWQVAANDPAVFDKYANRFLRLNQPREQLRLPGL